MKVDARTLNVGRRAAWLRGGPRRGGARSTLKPQGSGVPSRRDVSDERGWCTGSRFLPHASSNGAVARGADAHRTSPGRRD